MMIAREEFTINHVPKKSRQSTIKKANIATLLGELGKMLKSGIPLLSAIDLLMLHEKKATQCVLKQITEDLQSGRTLSDACKQRPNYFDKLTCQFILLGEQTGELDSLLIHAAELIHKNEKTKKEIYSALLYPTIVLCVSLTMISFMLIFVLPRFADLFHSMGAELPTLTKGLLQLSHLFRIIAAPGLCLIILLRKPIYTLCMNISKQIAPFNALWKQSYQLQLLRILAYAQRAGIDLHTALTLAANASIDQYFLNHIEQIKENITLGFPLSQALSQHNFYPNKIVQLVKIGESTGDLDNMLINITLELEEKQHRLFSYLSKLVEPVIMVILGVLMGGMVISLYLPVFKMGDLF